MMLLALVRRQWRATCHTPTVFTWKRRMLLPKATKRFIRLEEENHVSNMFQSARKMFDAKSLYRYVLRNFKTLPDNCRDYYLHRARDVGCARGWETF